jgi:hypothetical protein
LSFRKVSRDHDERIIANTETLKTPVSVMLLISSKLDIFNYNRKIKKIIHTRND